MKRLKKTLALALALILTLAMSTAVFAENNESGGGDYSITITNAASGHTYEAYQIFSGKLSDGKLIDVKWGNGVTAYTSNGKKIVVNAGDDAAVEAKNVQENQSNDTLEAYVKTLTLADKATATSGQGEEQLDGTYTYTISNLAAGYYVVKDKDGTVTDGEYTSYIVEVVGTVTVQPKTSETTSKKKVMDINDSEETHNDGWQDSADYDIGDDVPFQLTATITDKYAYYDVYYLAFHDKQDQGLTFQKGTVKVTLVNGSTKTDITSYFKVDENPSCESETFDIVCENLKDVDGVVAGSKIVVTYSSTLNASAKRGSDGNWNTMYLEYSNNPNETGGGSRGYTPDDSVVVFTYKVVINKVTPVKGSEDEYEALPGAEFKLYKLDAEGNETEVTLVSKNNDGTEFTFDGIDDGDYVLRETQTPPGYNSIDDITFTVVAKHVTDEDQEELTLKSLTGDTVTGEITFTESLSDGKLATNVVNYSGSTLPSTGGTGRVLLYVIGAILVVGVGVILVSKKRAQQ